jgi:hypothetical protein
MYGLGSIEVGRLLARFSAVNCAVHVLSSAQAATVVNPNPPS